MASQFTNTNEVGRSALIAPALAHVTAGWDDGWGLVEAGASAGINLRYDRFHLDYGEAGSLGDPDSLVHVTCSDRTGALVVPAAMPEPVERVGLDQNPIDLTDDAARLWLLACTWPDTDRLGRTAAAHELVATDPPRLVTGDMVDDLPALLDATAPGLPIVVLTTWAVGYLAPDRRTELGAALAAASTDAAGGVGERRGPGHGTAGRGRPRARRRRLHAQRARRRDLRRRPPDGLRGAGRVPPRTVAGSTGGPRGPGPPWLRPAPAR